MEEFISGFVFNFASGCLRIGCWVDIELLEWRVPGN